MKLSVPTLLILCFCGSVYPQTGFSFREPDGISLRLEENGKPVFSYIYGMYLKDGFPEEMRRSTYLHPVYLPDGRVITDDFNPDHAHHRGISWMWPVVRAEGQTYDLWTVGKIKQRFERWVARKGSPERAVLAVENGWYVGGRKVVKEFVQVSAYPVTGGTRRLDFLLQLEADSLPVEIAGTPDGKKGFGGFCFRFAPRDPGSDGKAKTIIRTEKGISSSDGVLETHAWAQIEGLFAGRPGGARVVEDASNPGHPNGWLMRHGFGFLNPSWPGLTSYRLERGKPLELRYCVFLYAGDPPER